MDKIYLIHEWPTDHYKIGFTKGTVEKRLKTLQTGNPNELTVVAYFESEYARLIESTFHRLNKHRRISGEWFDLSPQFVHNFINECANTENNFKMLKESENIFFTGK